MNREGTGRVIHWGCVFCQTDVGGLWTWAKVRPTWFWALLRLWLFVRIVWRRVDSRCPGRLDWRTAWQVSDLPGLSRVRVAGRTLDGRTHDETVTVGDATLYTGDACAVLAGVKT